MNISKFFSPASRQSQNGQGMSEYLIMVGVIAVASIVVFGTFGDTMEQQVNAAANALAGDGGEAVEHKNTESANNMQLEEIQ